MTNERIILIDFWGTIVESEKRNKLWGLVLKDFENLILDKKDIFGYWKERWFKSDINKGEFIQELIKRFELGSKTTSHIEDILNYKNFTPINGRIDSLSKLMREGYEIHLVSDCGYDTKEFVENSALNNILSKRFYSFVYKTTKEENLYGLVAEEIGTSCIMIGDDYKRDYKIPKEYGFSSALIRKIDILEDIICKS